MNTTLSMNDRMKAQFIETGLTAAMTLPSANRLMECATFTTAAPRQKLFHEGDRARQFFSVVTGYVRLFRQNSDGREADIRICGPGDTFGAELVFAGNIWTYDAEAADKAMLVSFDLEKVREIAAGDDGSFARAIAASVSAELQDARDCIAGDRLNTALQRVAHYLIEQCPGGASPQTFRLACRKSLLAGKLGLAPEALSRAFATLKTLGVHVQGRTIEITDIEALKAL
ncbi:Crp/Fnr family transcriptional regulator [Martelella limonii]|uniref:Crp/Fnr family transcriptional regulator n=1 Tax=Martelella limonii TaxID=1647649 RepID=UPI0015807C1B|nr:cyclic nucleotide-binding domain-containing protein [Martelella limonii]